MKTYILYGDDTFNINQRIKKIKQLIDDAWSFNYCKMHESTTPKEVINELLTPPLGGANKIVHVDNDCLFKDADNTKKVIKGKFELMPAGNILLITTTKKPALNTVVVKELLKYGAMEEYALISEWDISKITSYIKNAATSKRVNLNGKCIEYLVDNIGANTELIDSELNKINTFGKNITLEQLQQLVGSNHSNSVELAKYCLNGNSEKAYTKLNQLNDHPLQIVAALYTCFRTWLAVKAGIDEGLNNTEIALSGAINNPNRVYFLREEVRNCSLSRLRNILSILTTLEYELKTGKNTLPNRIIEIASYE
ncbi:hypothetical protein CAL7716_102300 (plasmid) [Calothrix sp. PCC 7716]|nr:hypothetical protein CAL7716_102300 [Calothrix sp. PCC 7716]